MSTTGNQTTPAIDPAAGRRAHAAGGLMGAFAGATVLDAADVQVARTLHRLAGGAADAGADGGSADDDLAALAAAFAVRAVRLGSVTVDLATIADTATVDEGTGVDLSTLPWPDPARWVAAAEASPVVAVGEEGSDVAGDARPLRLLGTALALDRYWRHERAVAADLLARAARRPEDVDAALLAEGLRRVFPGAEPTTASDQWQAAETAVRQACTVVAGGPGTGKTTTVARILALLHEQAATTGRPLRVALAAPTGKAAARLQEAVHAEVRTLDTSDDVRRAVLGAEASTIHRLLGRRPGSNSRFRHDRSNQLPHQVVVVDETSMVSLSMMARLLDAVRPSARLVLVGDPQQLASVEAGAVLGDIVGPAAGGPTPAGPLQDSVVVLREVYRYAGGVGELARGVEAGDPDTVVELLGDAPDGLRWLPVDVASAEGRHAADALRQTIVEPAAEVVRAARAGDATRALAAMRGAQLLCAHRRGPHGVSTWRTQVERWLTESVDGYDHRGWYAGRPLLVTENDYNLELFNGDTGVVVDVEGRLQCAFERRGGAALVSPSRLAAVETLYAMTIHKSQGSQFGEVVVILPDESSPILTRELLYTAVTRAENAVTVVGTEAAVRAAVERPITRASGLRHRLWPTP